MSINHYTIGMAGHIDHGKTTLTKALTNIDTDRLKEEKERNISIELGYAPLQLGDGMEVSIVDVPGHERFIRQMIAGVAGIDMVVLVIAADEGVMPQTKEHVEILNFLGIEHAIIALTKISRVEEELVEIVIEDIKEELEGTIFADAEIVQVDSIEKTGIQEMRDAIRTELERTDYRDMRGAFRLPIDQVFTVQGQGTVVRGTVYEGTVAKNQQLFVLPEGLKVKARQIQVHHQETELAVAGQRAAINLGGVTKNDLGRGDVLVSTNHFVVTDTIDVSMQVVKAMRSPLKQRGPVKIHIGTAEVMGKIIFFDRNELTSDDQKEILCQIRLNHPIVTKRGDRFILRRPTPVETLGGGWVIDPQGERYRFGKGTIDLLTRKKEGTPLDRIIYALTDHKLLTKKELIVQTSLVQEVLEEAIKKGEELGDIIPVQGDSFALKRDMEEMTDHMKESLEEYHEAYPLRLGINKAEMIQSLSSQYPKRFQEFVIEHQTSNGQLKRTGQFLALPDFEAGYPKQWHKRMENAVAAMEKDGLEVKAWSDYTDAEKLPVAEAQELKQFLLQTGKGFSLDDKMLISKKALYDAAVSVYKETEDQFALQEAKAVLGLSRKYLVPLMEMFDQLSLTVRTGDKRKWVRQNIEKHIES